MTERWDHSMEAQITSKMHELIACMCVVNFKQEGDRRGRIEQKGQESQDENDDRVHRDKAFESRSQG